MTQIIMVNTPASPPTSYESHLETPEGIYVKLIYNTSNKASADRYADEAAQKLGWRVLETPPATSSSVWAELGGSWILAFSVPLIVGMVAFVGAIFLNMAKYIGFDTVDLVAEKAVRWGIWSVPIIGITLTVLTLLNASSRKKHV